MVAFRHDGNCTPAESRESPLPLSSLWNRGIGVIEQCSGPGVWQTGSGAFLGRKGDATHVG